MKGFCAAVVLFDVKSRQPEKQVALKPSLLTLCS